MRSIPIVALLTIGALLIIPGCSKSDQPTATSSGDGLWKLYKDSIPGTWIWHHTYLYIDNMSGVKTLTTYADTAMLISLVSDSTLGIGGTILSYSDSVHYANGPFGSPVDTANFVHYWEKGRFHSSGDISRELLLNRHNDSLFYTINRTGTALGSQRYEYFNTKIFH